MKRKLAVSCLVLIGAIASPVQAETALEGTVKRVWEDGFVLNIGERLITIDSWDVYGDNTEKNLVEGERVNVTGEFSEREFDAFTIEKLSIPSK